MYVGRKSTFEISSRPYLTNDFALRPCFRIFIGLTYISLCSPTRYAHTKAMQTIANRRAIRTLSRRWVSSMLKPEDFMARNALCKALHKAFYDKYIVMRSDQKSTINYQYYRRILLRSTSHNEDYFFSPLSQSLRFLLPSQDLSESRLGVRFIYAFSRASRFAFESARA